MKHQSTLFCLSILALLAMALAGCADVDVSINLGGTPVGSVPTATAAAPAAIVSTPEPSIAPALGASATPPETSAAQAAPADSASPAAASATQPPAPAATAVPTSVPQAPAATQPTAAAPTAVPTRVPLRPTAPSCASYQGTPYTVTWNEQQINATLDAALRATERAYVGIRSVSLQNGQIAAQTQYRGPAGKTVDGTLVVAVSARNYDLLVQVVQAQVGQVGMTDARKTAINIAVENALETQMAQAHDYTCVDSATIANGTMTIVYH